MEKRAENRITKGLLDWVAKESRLREVFGSGVSNGKDFLGVKRDFFNALYKACKQDTNAEEKVMLPIVRGEIRKMEKRLYPNAAVRLVAKLGESVKEWLHPGRGTLSEQTGMASGQVRRKGTEYSRGAEKREQLHESGNSLLSTYRKKSPEIKGKKGETKTSSPNEKELLPKKRLNPGKGYGLH